MKLHADNHGTLNAVTAYGPGFVEVNRRRHAGALIVRPEGEVLAWGVDGFEALSIAHFEALLEHAPEVVLLGTGARQRFPGPALWAGLARARIGVEAMDTGAACRTYNILMGEGRRVLAALLPL
ncbi:MAG: Mth938-like domain-containing protein [Burkholderiaceae bacterium]